MFQGTIRSILACFTAAMVWRIYSSQFNSTQFFSDLALAVILGVITTFSGGRAYNYSSVRVTVNNWQTFWHEFMEMVAQTNFSPVCQMDDNYFFEHNWFGTKTRLTLKRVAGNQWEVEFPSGMHKLINSKLGIYSKLSLLTADAETKLRPL